MQEWTHSAESGVEEKVRGIGSGMRFPASKSEIIAHAQNQHLPREVISQLQKLPDRTYDNLGDMVSSAVRAAL